MDNDLEEAGVPFAEERRTLASPSIVERISRVAGDVAGLAILAMTVMVAYDVLMRYLFNSPTSWADEVSGYLLVGVVFLGAAYTSRIGGHIRLEVLSGYVSAKVRHRLGLISAWVALIFIAFLAWQSAVQVVDSYLADRRQFSLLLTQTYLPQIPIAIGLLLFLAELVDSAGLRERRPRGRMVPVSVVAIVTAIVLAAGPRFGWSSLTNSFVLAAGLLVIMFLISGLLTTALVAGGVACLATLLVVLQGGSATWTLLILSALMMVLLIIGVPIAMTLGLVGLFGIFFLIPGFRPITLAERAWTVTNSFELTAVPVFILMGELLLGSGLTNDLYQNLGKWIGRVRGGFAHASMAACAIFAAVSGSSVATAATIGTVAAPEMIGRGYSPRLAYGSLAAGGTLGILIPPSISMLIYGSMMGVSIGDLFIAGVIPGLMLTGLFMLVIVGWSIVQPEATPKGLKYSWKEKFSAIRHMAPVVSVIGLVLGGLYLGVVTPTEAGVVGCVASVILCVATGKFNWTLLRQSLLSTVRTTSFIIVIVVGASCMNYILDYLRVPSMLATSIRDLGWAPWAIMLGIFVGYIILGAIMDGISMMVITLPVVFPAVVAMGFEPIWFGVVMTVLIEVGLIHPPVGLNLFVLHGIAQRITPETTISDIAIGALPFLAQMFVLLGLLLAYPGLATWLPRHMGG